MSDTSQATIIDAADFYTSKLNWSVHPLEPGGKTPTVKGWNGSDYLNRPWELRRNDFVHQSNIGMLSGPNSGNVCGLDMDWPEARQLAERLLSGLWTLGREGKLPGMYLVTCKDATKEKKWNLTKDEAASVGGSNGDGHDGMICEFRVNDNIMLPPSVHANGERVVWTHPANFGQDGVSPPQEYPFAALEKRLNLIAVLSVVLRNYPRVNGNRDEICLALSGTLLTAGYSAHDADRLVTMVAELAGDEESSKRGKAQQTADKQSNGDETTGLPRLCELLGIEPLQRKLAKWLGSNKANAANATPPSDSILDEGGRLLESIAAMESVLLSEYARPIFQRGEFLVRPRTIGTVENGDKISGERRTTDDGEQVIRDGGIERAIGTPTIRRVSAGWIQREVAAHSKWCKRASKGFVPIDPPAVIATHILEKVGEWRFPVLNGILNTPTIRPDGSLLGTPGYDPLTGLLLDTGGVVFPSVPQHPTIDDARAALEFLASPYRAYIFADNGSKSVLLAALLTAIYRPMMQHAPMFNFDASDPGSGKGKLAKCVGMMSVGRRPAHMNLDPRDTEFITAFSAVLLAGDPVIWIDNISRPLGGIDVLDSAITEPIAKIRILGVSETRECPCRALLIGTGNNITLKGDMPRRALVSRIESDCEKPEEKRFEFDPVREFAAGRTKMVAAALTILRAYIINGKPGVDDLKPFGSFDDLDVVRGSLGWLKQRDPCDTRMDIMPVDDAKSHFAEFVSEWHRQFGDKAMTMNEVRRAALNNPNEFLVMVEAMRLATRQPVGEGIGSNFDARITGRRLDAKWKGKVTGGLKFVRAGERDHSALWQVVKVSSQLELLQTA